MKCTTIALIFFFAFSCFCAGQTAFAQQEDFTRDASFFYQQKDSFQLWLGQLGIGDALQVKTLQLDKTHLSLNLGFKPSGRGSAVQAWDSLKQSFEAKYQLPFEHYLFYKMAALMEVWQSEADLQIYGPDSGFHRAVYFQNGAVQVGFSPTAPAKD